MGCKKDKPSKKPKPGDFQCASCGAVRSKKDALCEPKKVKLGGKPR